MSNYISAMLSPEDQKIILDCLATVRSKLSFCIKLSDAEQQTIPKLSDGRLPFVQKSLSYGASTPVIVSPYTDLKGLDIDVKLFDTLGPVARELSSLTEMIVDTRTAAGSDAYSAALIIYKSAQGAAKSGVPGTQAIVDDLKKLFEGQGKTKTDPNTK
jgi:hypothetical protein